ncbi:4-(cytidine 5'-diphospho)-2-C-methyl-D-erythritol kinase [Thiohalorhabdus sp.]|uniref:4-(cytidine 5'-diphospho)-2-C-methyl-D-erythritol kinase n=1 Tax=Thiohalorhabdus sp. TaxID=3094134 RepID=UPI002FC383BC
MSAAPAAGTEPLSGPGWQGDEHLLAPAPAKLNLFLHITGRRSDGMHELQTLFQFLDWGDRLRFEPLEEQLIERAVGVAGIAPDQDLVLRAARLLAAHTGYPGGVRVAVDKHLPVGGGLGGGSSDAATTLLVLNRLWGAGLGRDELAVLGAELGADVPVFIGGRAAWAEGVGEQLTPAGDIAEPWYLVVWPKGVQVDTGKAFGDPNLTRHHPLVTIEDFSRGRCDNDFVAVVERRHPDIARIREWLESLAPTPGRLTGSGACLFAACASYEEAAALRARAPEAWGAAVARGCNRHPLADWAFPEAAE